MLHATLPALTSSGPLHPPGYTVSNHAYVLPWQVMSGVTGAQADITNSSDAIDIFFTYSLSFIYFDPIEMVILRLL